MCTGTDSEGGAPAVAVRDAGLRRLWSLAALATIVGALGACAAAPVQPDRAPDANPSAARMVEASAGLVAIAPDADIDLFAEGWEPWVLHPTKRRTNYLWSCSPDGSILTAIADAAASGLTRSLQIDPAAFPNLEWRWRVDALIPGADNTDPDVEDSPARIVLAFEGNRSALPARDRLFFEQVRLFSGRDLPYATLMYIWENQRPTESVLPNPHTGRVRKLVVASGGEKLGRWVQFRRNIVEDYRRAFGADPGRLVGIAILTDTDNTGEQARAQYGGLRLSPRPLQAPIR